VEAIDRASPAAAPAEAVDLAIAPVSPPPAAAPKPAVAGRTSAPSEELPVAARVTATGEAGASSEQDEDDLRERIRLAAQRAVAASSISKPAAVVPAAPKPAIQKPSALKPVAAKPATVRRSDAPPTRPRKTEEPQIFVPPRAPDDPGPELTEESSLEMGPFRPSGAKA
jgi:hypothetical protein